MTKKRCPQHDTHKEGCIVCELLKEKKDLQSDNEEKKKQSEEQKKQIEDLQSDNEGKKKQIEDLQSRIEDLQSDSLTFEQFINQKFDISNETGSSAHCDTGHEPASSSRLSKFPDVELPNYFWSKSSKILKQIVDDNINSGPEVTHHFANLLKEIIDAIGLGDFISMFLDVPIFDTAADLGVLNKLNKTLIGTAEGKKDPSTKEEYRKIFGSNTAVCGEVFEQLFLSIIQNDTFAVGLVYTLKSFQLVCSRDICEGDELSVLKVEDARKCFESIKQSTEMGQRDVKESSEGVSPLKPKVIDDSVPDATSPVSTKVPSLKSQKISKSDNPGNRQSQKNGRVARAASATHRERKYYASKPVSFSSSVDGNREVIRLLVAYILLCVKSMQEVPQTPLALCPTDESTRAVRKIKGGHRHFCFASLTLPAGGVKFESLPMTRETQFNLIRMLGFGQNGITCFGCTNSFAPVVVKFFRVQNELTETKDAAKLEAEMWKNIYGDYFPFSKYFETPRPFITMPFLWQPSTYAERHKVVYGEEDSMLYKALDHLVSKGYIHKEVYWRHVGICKKPNKGNFAEGIKHFFTTTVPKLAGMKRSADDNMSSNNETSEIVILCDLAHVEKRHLSKKERREWVESSFKFMKNRMGTDPYPATYPK